ncbi:MAG: glycosyltransferase family 2 protein [bacterium]|nr:glycosyltransferase family 2 protein [bacterium]
MTVAIDKDPTIFVLIPVLNEAESIGKVLGDIPDIVTETIVIDNGSTDNSRDVVTAHGGTSLSESTRGYGWALMKGINYIAGKNPDIVVFLDGDYSDHPEELHDVIRPIIEDDYDLVIGSRVLGVHEKGALLPQARFGNWLSTFLIRLFWNYHFTDLGPFRAIKFDVLTDMDMKELTYGWTVEMQIKGAQKKYKCTEVPVKYRKRIGQSKVTGTVSGSVKAGLGILRTIFMSLFRK